MDGWMSGCREEDRNEDSSKVGIEMETWMDAGWRKGRSDGYRGGNSGRNNGWMDRQMGGWITVDGKSEGYRGGDGQMDQSVKRGK